MKNFHLINSSREVVSKTKSQSKEEAVEYFSKIKKLEKKELLKIYKVIEE